MSEVRHKGSSKFNEMFQAGFVVILWAEFFVVLQENVITMFQSTLIVIFYKQHRPDEISLCYSSRLVSGPGGSTLRTQTKLRGRKWRVLQVNNTQPAPEWPRFQNHTNVLKSVDYITDTRGERRLWASTQPITSTVRSWHNDEWDIFQYLTVTRKFCQCQESNKVWYPALLETATPQLFRKMVICYVLRNKVNQL